VPRTWRVGPHGKHATVQAAADLARPGDTVAIEAGTYPGGRTVRRDGVRGRPIRFAGIGGTAVLTGARGSLLIDADRCTGRNTVRNNVFGDGPVDAGSPERAHAFDLDGVARPAGAGFDIGACERRWP
jgi:hypothetical protein